MNLLGSALSVMTARDNDVDDVRWALSTAKVQWDRGGRSEAADWLRRAAQAAETSGNFIRAHELREGVQLLLAHNGVEVVNAAYDVSELEIEVDVEEEAPVLDVGDGEFVSDDDIELLDDVLLTEIDDDDLQDAETIPPAAAASWASSKTRFGLAPSASEDNTGEWAPSDGLQEGSLSSPPRLTIPQVQRNSSIPASAPGFADEHDQESPVRASIASAPALEFEDVSWNGAEADERTPAQALEETPLESDEVRSARSSYGVVESAPGGPLSVGDPREGLDTLIDIDLDAIPPVRPGEPQDAPGQLPARARRAPEDGASFGEMPLLEPLQEAGEAHLASARSFADAELGAVGVGGEVAAVRPPSGKPSVSEGQALVDGVALASVAGFEDLPAEVQQHLADLADVGSFDSSHDIGSFGAAVVTHGAVEVCFANSKTSTGVQAIKGEVIFAQGTLKNTAQLRVVAKLGVTRVATWQSEAITSALEACPWVEDELRFIADRYVGVCGATLGALGTRLDESLRSALLQKLNVRVLKPGHVVVEANKPMDGLYVVGSGTVALTKDGAVEQVLSAGDFLFSTSVMSAAPAPATAIVGSDGALLMYAPRAVVHELVVSVPPLLEVLTG